MKVDLPLIKNVLVQRAKTNVLIPLGLTPAAAEAGIHIKVLGYETSGSGTPTLITPNKQMKDIMKIVKSLQVSGSEFINKRCYWNN